MSKVRKSILIIGILVIVVAASLATALALFASGSIKTDPIELVYSVKDAKKEYDGTPLKATEYRLDSGELGAGHHAEVEFLGEQTGVGNSRSDLSVKIYDKDGYNVTHGYNIKVIGGELSVSKKSISIELPNQTVTYNGSTVSFSDYRLTADSKGDLVSGHKIYGSTEAELLNVGDTLPNDLKPLVFDIVGNDVTANYDIEFTMGDIEVVPRHVSVSPVSYEKVYDGKEITAKDIKFVEGSLVEGQYAKYKINENLTNKLTDAGEEELEITDFKVYATIGGEEVDVTENYEIDRFETGKLKVMARPLTVKAKSGEWVYNGERQTFESDSEALAVEGLADGDSVLSVSYSGGMTDVGTAVNKISGVTLSCSSENYDVTRIDGAITVTPYKLKIETPTAEKYYDGEELSDTEVTCTLANRNHELVPVGAPVITDAQSVVNKFAYKVKIRNNGTDVTDNYSISYDYGTLTVHKMPVAVTLGSQNKTYNAQAQTPDLTADGMFTLRAGVTGEGIEEPALTEENFSIVSYSRNMVDAGEYSFSVKFKEESEDTSLSDNYVLEVTNYGFLIIDPVSIKVKTGTDEKDYDGLPLTCGTSEVVDGELVAGHTIDNPKALPSITEVGEIDNDFKVGVKDASDADVTKNYAISYETQKLTVKPRAISVELNDFTNDHAFTFNNAPVSFTAEEAITTITNATITVEDVETAVIEESDFTVVMDKIVNAGKDYTYTVKITDRAFANNFTLNVTDGEIDVDKAEVTVILRNFDITYDDREHTPDPYTAIKSIMGDTSGLLTYANFEITSGAFEWTQADDHYYSVKLKEVGRGEYINGVINDNYNITPKAEATVAGAAAGQANVKINKFPITITTATKVFEYNGEAQSCTEQTNSGLLVNSAGKLHKIEVVTDSVDTVTNAGDSVDNEFDVIIKSETTGATTFVTPNYDIDFVVGNISVVKRKITVTTPSISEVYDGAEHFNTTIDQTTVENLVSGHQVVYDGTGFNKVKLVADGIVSNEFGLKVNDGSDANVTDNYDITPVYGTLQITKRPISISTQDLSEVYSGSEYYDTTVTISDDTPLPSGEGVPDYRVKIADGYPRPVIKNVGKVENKFDVMVLDGDGTSAANVTENYEITATYGTLEVTPLAVTLWLKDFTEGNALTYNGNVQTFDVDRDHIIERESVTGLKYEIIYSGNFTDAGEATYTVRIIDWEDETSAAYCLAKNYTLTVYGGDGSRDYAKVEIKPMTVYVGLKTHVFTFDNTYKTVTLENSVLFDAERPTVRNIRKDSASGDLVSEELLNIDDLKIVQGSIIDAQDAPYQYSVRIPDRAKSRNFIVTSEGFIKINRAAVAVTVNDITRVYDGLTYSPTLSECITVGSELLNNTYFKIVLPAGVEIKNADTYNYTVTALSDAELSDRASYFANFDISYAPDANGRIVITPATVNVSFKDLTFTYDASDRSGLITPSAVAVADHDGYNVNNIDFNFIKDDGTAVVEVKNAGTYHYKATATVDSNFNVNLKKVAGKEYNGTITVAKAQASVVLDNKYETYNGNEVAIDDFRDSLIISCSGVNLSKGSFELKYTDTLEAGAGRAATPEHSKVGYYSYTAVFKNANDADNYDLSTAVGTLTIAARQVTVTTPSDSKHYNGEKLTAYGTTTEKPIILNNGVSGHKAKIKGGEAAAPSVIDVGTKQNKFDVVIKAADDTDVTENYTIRYEYGTLEITPVTVNIVTEDVEKFYDGTELESSAIGEIVDAVNVQNAIKVNANHSIVLKNTNKIKDVGETENKFTVTVSRQEGAAQVDATGNYVFNYTYGKLKVEKRGVQITLNDFVGDAKLTYNGGTHYLDRNAAYALSVSLAGKTDADTINSEQAAALLSSDDFEIKYSSPVKDAGDYEYWLEIVAASRDKLANFDISYPESSRGKITVVPANLTVTLADLSGTYSGEAYPINLDATGIISIPEKNLATNTNPDGLVKENFTVTYPNGEIKDAGTYLYSVELDSPQYAKNYNLTVVGGLVQIAPAAVTITLKDYTGANAFTYNGKRPEIDPSDAVTVNDHLNIVQPSDFVLSTSGVTVGTHTYSATLKSEELRKNFVLNPVEVDGEVVGVDVVSGNVEITKRKIYIGLNDLIISQRDYDEATAPFDVTSLVYISSGSPVEGDGFRITSATATQQGDQMRIALDDVDWTRKDCYEVTYDVTYDDALTARLIIIS